MIKTAIAIFIYNIEEYYIFLIRHYWRICNAIEVQVNKVYKTQFTHSRKKIITDFQLYSMPSMSGIPVDLQIFRQIYREHFSPHLIMAYLIFQLSGPLASLHQTSYTAPGVRMTLGRFQIATANAV